MAVYFLVNLKMGLSKDKGSKFLKIHQYMKVHGQIMILMAKACSFIPIRAFTTVALKMVKCMEREHLCISMGAQVRIVM